MLDDGQTGPTRSTAHGDCAAGSSSSVKMLKSLKTRFAFSELNCAAAKGVVLKFGRPRLAASFGHSSE